VFSGSKYTASVGTFGKKGYSSAMCELPTKTLNTIKLAHPKKDLDVPVAVDNLITYEVLFTGLGVCASATDERVSYIYENGARMDLSNSLIKNLDAEVSYDEDTFKTEKKTGNVKYSWRKQDKTTAGKYSFSQVFLPKKYDGGIVITHKSDAVTNVAIRVKNDLGFRYFNMETLKSMEVGSKTGKVAIPL
jgi:hypothetical protein